MLKSYEAFYDNGKLKWLGIPPHIKKAKVIVVVEEEEFEAAHDQSIKQLKGMAPKPAHAVSLEDMDKAIQNEGAKR